MTDNILPQFFVVDMQVLGESPYIEQYNEERSEGMSQTKRDTDPYIPICSWCGKPYFGCKCGK
jgi:hypothetical protein